MRMQPALGSCHIGFTAGVAHAVAWLDEGVLVIGHGSYLSWCDVKLSELHRETLPGHVHSVAALADGGVAACCDGGLIAIFSADRRPSNRFTVDGAWTVTSHATRLELGVVRRARDPQGFDYRLAERWTADGESLGTYGVAGEVLTCGLGTPVSFTPNLDVAFGSEWWGAQARRIGGDAGRIQNRETRERGALDDEHVALLLPNELQKVRFADGEVVAKIPFEASGGVRLYAGRGRVVAIVGRRHVRLFDADLRLVTEVELGNNLVSATPSPDLDNWLLAFSPDDVSPRTLAVASAGGKPKKLTSSVLEVHSTLAEDEGLLLGTAKGVQRVTEDAVEWFDVKAGAPRLMARVGDELAVFGSKLVFVDAAELKAQREIKMRASAEYIGLWTNGRDLVATSGARRVVLHDGDLHESKNTHNVKHVLAGVDDGELVFVDNAGWVVPGDRQALKLEEDDWYAAAVSTDGRRWAIDWHDRGVRISENRGKTLLRNVPSDANAVTFLAFSPSGERLGIGRVGAVELVDVDGEGTLRAAVPGQCGHLSFSPNGDTLYATLETHLGGPFGDLVPGEVRAFDCADLSERYRLIAGKGAVLKVFPDGTSRAIGKAKTAAKLGAKWP